jgi:hypothetical protein
MVPASGDSGQLPAAPAPAAAGLGGNAGKYFSFADLTRNLPGNINIGTDGQPNFNGIYQANLWLKAHLTGGTAELPVRFESTQSISNAGGIVYDVTGAGDTVLCRGGTLASSLIGIFSAASVEPVSQITPGGDMTVTGTIKSVNIQGRGDTLTLMVTLDNASMK